MHVTILFSTVAFSVVYFYIAIYLSAALSGTSTSVQGILAGFVTAPKNANTFYIISEFWMLPLVSLMFLPLLAPSQLVMVLPWFIVTLLVSSSPTEFSLGYQSAGAFVVPFLTFGAIFSIGKIHARNIDLRGLLVGIFLFSLILSPFNPLTQNRIPGITYQEGFPSVTSHDQVLQAALALIPSNASVLTQDNLFPQVSNRLEAYVYLTSNKTSIDFVLAIRSCRGIRKKSGGLKA